MELAIGDKRFSSWRRPEVAAKGGLTIRWGTNPGGWPPLAELQTAAGWRGHYVALSSL